MAFVPSGPLAAAIALHQQGQLEQARQGYEAILATEPSSAAAHHYLGLLEHQSGNTSAALQHLRRAAQSQGEAAGISNSWRRSCNNNNHHRHPHMAM
jgi:Tfp pilus assembly protein PilF